MPSTVVSLVRNFALVSILQKIVTFTLNQCLLRNTTPTVFGKTIQFELFLSTMLFLSREGIRLSILRKSNIIKDDNRDLQMIINLSWIPFALMFLSLVTIVRFVRVPDEDLKLFVYYNVSALLESAGEPWYNVSCLLGNVNIRLYAEGIAMVARAISTVVFVVYYDWELSGFGLAQIIYGFVYTASLICLSWLSTSRNDTTFLSLVPRFIWSRTFAEVLYDNIGGESFTLAAAMVGTIGLKHFSTESDKIVLSVYMSHDNQGVYNVASNYCSLIARLVFFPIEEACRLTFPRMISETRQLCTVNKVNTSIELVEIESKLQHMFEILTSLMQFIFLFSVIFPIFGPFYATIFVKIFLGSNWFSKEIVNIISCFCIYILIMGLNGVAEAFVQSVIEKKHMYIVTLSMIASSFTFAISVAVMVKLFGTCGIVLSLTISMFVRLMFNLSYIFKSFFNPSEYFNLPLTVRTLKNRCQSIFSLNLIAILIGVIGILYNSSSRNSSLDLEWEDLRYVGIGVFSLLILFGYLYFSRKKEIYDLVKIVTLRK
jgi:oligosaccharide translocation protein RFT1